MKLRVLSIFLCIMPILTVFANAVNSEDTQNTTIQTEIVEENVVEEINFIDIKTSDWFYEDVMTMAEKGILNGYLDNSFKPQNNITYGEIFKVVCEAFDIGKMQTEANAHWAKGYYDALVAQNIILENFDLTQINNYATRDDLANLIFEGFGINSINILQVFEDTNSSVVNTLYELGIINGVSSEGKLFFYPNTFISRAEACAIVNRSDSVFQNTKTITKEYYTHPEVPLIERPQTIADFENVLLYMAVNGITYHEIPYSDIGFDDLIGVYMYDDMAHDAFNTVFDKYPEYFTFANSLNVSVEGYSSRSTIKLVLNSSYYEIATINQMKSDFFAEMEDTLYALEISGQITEQMSEYEKAFAIFEHIVMNKKYDIAYSDLGYTAYGMSEFNEGVCQAYVANFMVLCDLLGIESYGVSAIYDESHIWVEAILDGKTIIIDPTFADPVPDIRGYVEYKYFDIEEAELIKAHMA